MTTAATAPEKTPAETEPPGRQTADVVVVGAGFGLDALYRLRGLGLTVVCLEAGDGVGGTWYWQPLPRRAGRHREHAVLVLVRR